MITLKSISYHRGKIKRVYLADNHGEASSFAWMYSGTLIKTKNSIPYMVIIS